MSNTYMSCQLVRTLCTSALLALILMACTGGSDGQPQETGDDLTTTGGDGDGAGGGDDAGGDDVGGDGDDSGADADVPPWQPALCQASASPACQSVTHELPIPTHFSSVSSGFSFMSADAPSLFAAPGLPESYALGGCYPAYNYGLMPALDDYPADRYTGVAIGDSEASAWADGLCAQTGFPVRHVFPPRGDGSQVGDGPASRACVTQVVHAVVADDSLYTVILPPSWDASAPAGTYPILFNGHYDLHTNVFHESGAKFVRWVASSGDGGKRGVIGVLWNGGGAYASRTMSPHTLDVFAQIIDEVATRYRGNPQWIVTTGGSRGGVTALRMAANPEGHPYRVVATVALVPPALLGDHARLASVTYPPLLHAMGWTVGLQDAWRWGWTYPVCAGRPELTGLSNWEAHMKILTGTSDPDLADAQHSLAGEVYLDALEESGVQIYLGIGEHDFIVPYAHQVRLAAALAERAMPAQIEVLIRGGHDTIRTRLGGAPAAYELHEKVLEDILAVLASPSLELSGAVPPLVTSGIRFHRVNRQSGEAELFTPTGGYPFSVDIPYYAIAGQSFPIVVVGEPGTSYAITATYVPSSQVAGTIEGVIPSVMTATHWIDLPLDQPLGAYSWTAALTPAGGSAVSIPTTATITGAACTTEVLGAEPALDYVSVASAAQPPTLPGYAGTNWGLSEY